MDLPVLDQDLFTDKEIASLEKLASECAEATTPAAIVTAGAKLDDRKTNDHTKIRKALARDKILTAFYKQLIFEVPRRLNQHGDQEAVVE